MNNRFFKPLSELDDIIASDKSPDKKIKEALLCLLVYGENGETILVAEDEDNKGNRVLDIQERKDEYSNTHRRMILYTTDEYSFEMMRKSGVILLWNEVLVDEALRSAAENNVDEILIISMGGQIVIPNPFKKTSS